MKRNIPKLYFFSFFSMFFVSLPVWVPYFQGFGFSMQDVFTVQAIFACSVAAFEIPSGYFCDLFGRRMTLIFGGICYGLSFSWLAFATTFWEVVLFEVGAALAMSLISGADVALLYESMDANISREDKGKILGNVQFAQLFSEAGGAILGGSLAGYGLALPFKVQAIVAWFPLIIALGLIEGPRQTMSKTNHKENFGMVFKHIFLSSAELRKSFINLVVWGLSTFMAVWTLQKYWEIQSVPVSWFGYLWAAGNLSAALMSRQAAKLNRVLGAKACALVSCALPILGYFGMGLGGGLFGVAFGLGLYLGRGLIQVVMREEFNHYIPNEFRATANSIQSFCFRGVFAVTGPGIGWAIDTYGVQMALLGLGSIFVIFYLMFIVTDHTFRKMA